MPLRKLFLATAFVSVFLSACGRRHVTATAPSASPTRASAPTSRAPESRKRPAHRDSSSETAQEASIVPLPSLPSPSQETLREGYTEVGYASWYGDPYHGRRAANGEIYDKYKLTAAHLTLPFGAEAKVTDLENNKSVVVRITDRGPFVKGRIIDLSLAAARKIQMVGPGTALVKLEVLSLPEEPESGEFAVQAGAYRDRATAERIRDRLSRKFGKAFVEPHDSSDGKWYRVRIGPQDSFSRAREIASQLGRENVPAFVVRVDN